MPLSSTYPLQALFRLRHRRLMALPLWLDSPARPRPVGQSGANRCVSGGGVVTSARKLILRLQDLFSLWWPDHNFRGPKSGRFLKQPPSHLAHWPIYPGGQSRGVARSLFRPGRSGDRPFRLPVPEYPALHAVSTPCSSNWTGGFPASSFRQVWAAFAHGRCFVYASSRTS